MAGSGRKNRDAQLAVLVAAGESTAVAAAKIGISERTAFRRAKDPDFRRTVDDLRTGLLELAIGKLSSAGAKAVDVLLELLDSATSESVRLQAARATLEHLFRGRELIVVARQVEELEHKLEEIKNERKRETQT